MSKRGRGTRHSVYHGNKNNKLHKDDAAKNKALRKKRLKDSREPREAIPPEEEPVFGSDVSGLNCGGCYRVEKQALIPMEGEAWENALWEACLNYNWYHQLQVSKTKKDVITSSYKKREIHDREKRGKTDKHGRPETDVDRETIDCRPDHSRAIQYMLEQGLKEDAAAILEQARILKIRMFEKVYDRRALFTGEHDDSGQHHDDIWHTGIQEDDEQMIRGREGREWVFRPKRTRNPFLSYGVGIGAASWSRHFSALRDAAYGEKDIKSFANLTMAALDEDTLQIQERHKCRPRDVRLLSVLDRVVHRMLKKRVPALLKKANREYATFLEENYRAGKMGVKKSKRRQIKDLGKEIENLRKAEQKLKIELQQAKAAEQEAFATADILKPRPQEGLAGAAERIVRERDDAITREKTVLELIAHMLKAVRELGNSAVKLLGEALAIALRNLGQAVNIDLGFDANPQETITNIPLSTSTPAKKSQSEQEQTNDIF